MSLNDIEIDDSDSIRNKMIIEKENQEAELRKI